MAGEADGRAVVLWDLDRTLADLHVPLAAIAVWKQALQARFGPGGWTGGWSPLLPSLERALDAAGATAADRDDAYAVLDEWELEALTSIDVHDGPLAVAAALDAAGVAQGIVTNNGRPAADVALAALANRAAALGLAAPRFDAVVARGASVRAKPAPDGLAVAAARAAQVRYGGAPRAGLVVMVGDMPGDAAAATALGETSGAPVAYVRAAKGRLFATPDAARRIEAAGLAALYAAVLPDAGDIVDR